LSSDVADIQEDPHGAMLNLHSENMLDMITLASAQQPIYRRVSSGQASCHSACHVQHGVMTLKFNAKAAELQSLPDD
jgi:hypothetical protein